MRLNLPTCSFNDVEFIGHDESKYIDCSKMAAVRCDKCTGIFCNDHLSLRYEYRDIHICIECEYSVEVEIK